MESKRKIPYGVINWVEIVREYLCMDKTACVHKSFRRMVVALALSASCCSFADVANAVEIDGGYAVLRMDESARIISIREKATGRELVAKQSPFLRATFEGGAEVESSSLRPSGKGGYEARFGKREGSVAFDVEPYFGGWTFRIRKVTLEGVKSLQAGRIVPACGKYVGNLANMVSDDDSGVCLRTLSSADAATTAAQIRIVKEMR